MAALYRIWTSVFFLAVVVQVGLAGYGAFHNVSKADDKGSITKKTVDDRMRGRPRGFGMPHHLACPVCVLASFWRASAARGTHVLWAITLVLHRDSVRPRLGWRRVPAIGFACIIRRRSTRFSVPAHRAWTKKDAPATATGATA